MSRRLSRSAVALAIVTLGLVARAAAANEPAVLLEVVGERSGATAPFRAMVAQAIADAGGALLDEASTRAAAEAGLVAPPPIDVDVAFLRRASIDATGRNLYFESRFEEAASVLGETEALVMEHPELLAYHPDLVRSTFEALITLSRTLDAMGEAEEAQSVLERAVTRMWGARLAPEDAPPSVHAQIEATRALVPTREVEVQWRGGRRCALWMDGALVTSEAVTQGAVQVATLRVPAGEHAVEVRCEGGRSLVHLLHARRTALSIDLAYDDALDLSGQRALLSPRDRDPQMVERLAAHAAGSMGVAAVYTVSLVERRDGASVVELTRYAGSPGEATFRAVRIRAEELPRAGVVEEAVRFLRTGSRHGSLAVWDRERGWPSESVRHRSTPAWVLGGAALGVVAGAIVLEVRGAESRRDIDTCADGAEVTCDVSLMPALRSDARRARGWATAAWATSAALAAGAVTAKLVARSGARVDASARVGGDGVAGALRVRW